MMSKAPGTSETPEASDASTKFEAPEKPDHAPAVKTFAKRKEAIMHSKNTVLYYKPTCPFCQKVIAYMEEHEIDLEKRDVRDTAVKQELVSIGGKGQVPCLVEDGKALYESDDIIAYLDRTAA